MSDAPDDSAPKYGTGTWAAYVRDLTERPGWNVARLARASGVNRSTLFRWIGGDVTDVKVSTVLDIAHAAGVDEGQALLAAGGVLSDEVANIDFEIAMIERSEHLNDGQKRDMIREARRLRAQHLADLAGLQERQQRERRDEVERWLRFASGPPPAMQ